MINQFAQHDVVLLMQLLRNDAASLFLAIVLSVELGIFVSDNEIVYYVGVQKIDTTSTLDEKTVLSVRFIISN